MYSVARTFALCVGLAQLRLVICLNYSNNESVEDSTTEAVSHCDYPKIIVKNFISGAVLFRTGNKLYGDPHHGSIEYGHLIKVRCVGTNATQLILKQDGAKLETNSSNDRIIERLIGEPGITKLKYECMDINTNCETWASISITPSIYVSPATLQEDLSAPRNTKYITEYGNSVTIKCYGQASSRLTMTKDGEELETANVNVQDDGEYENTIEWFAKKPDLQISNYVCTDIHTNISRSVIITVKPAICVQTQNEIVPGSFSPYSLDVNYNLEYGSVIEIFCTGPSAVTLFTVEEKLLHEEILTEKLNKTTVKSSKITMETGTSFIACVDREVPSYMNTMTFRVAPRINVLSPGMRYVSDRYYIKYGVPFEIVCSGSNATRLSINKDDETGPNNLNYKVNETTIKWNIKDDSHVTDVYVCEEGELASEVTVHALPNVLSLRCVSYNLEYMKCSWSSLEYYRNLIYTLFYMERVNSAQICTKSEENGKITSKTRTHSCVWNYPSDIKEFSLVMQSCDELVGCFNQTFLIDHLSTLKLAPPGGLSSTYRFGLDVVFLRWYTIWTSFDIVGADEDLIEYKVEYSYPGTQPVEVNSPVVSCTNFDCVFELKLLCPNQFYNIQVYRKLKKTVGEEYWSDPSSITVYTNFIKTDKHVDSKCYREAQETKELMVYSTHKLNNDVNLELREMGGKVRSLKDKRSLIHASLKQQRKTDEL